MFIHIVHLTMDNEPFQVIVGEQLAGAKRNTSMDFSQFIYIKQITAVTDRSNKQNKTKHKHIYLTLYTNLLFPAYILFIYLFSYLFSIEFSICDVTQVCLLYELYDMT